MLEVLAWFGLILVGALFVALAEFYWGGGSTLSTYIAATQAALSGNKT